MSEKRQFQEKLKILLKGIAFYKRIMYIIIVGRCCLTEKRLDNMKIKTETFANKYPLTTMAVGDYVDKLIANFIASPKNFELLETLFEWGYVRPTRQVGRGRYSKLDDRLESVKTLLDVAHIKYVICNDAPKCGKCGNIIALADGWVGVKGNEEVRYHSVQQGINTNTISAELFKIFGVAEERV